MNARHRFMIGPIGALRAIQGPGPGYQAEVQLGVTTHKLLSGNVRTSAPPRSLRTYNLSFDYLTDVELAKIQECALSYTSGALVWADPFVRNQLPPEVSTGTIAFTGAAGASQVVGPAVPVLPGSPWTGQVRVAGTGIVRAEAVWFDAAGAQVGVTTGDQVVTSAQRWRLAVSYSPPAVAVTGRLRVAAVTASVVSVDRAQVEWGPLSDWVPGPGLAYVVPLTYVPSFRASHTTLSMTLQEVR